MSTAIFYYHIISFIICLVYLVKYRKEPMQETIVNVVILFFAWPVIVLFVILASISVLINGKDSE